MSGTQEQEKQLEVAGAMEDVRPPSAFHDIQNFENAQRMAQALASSTLVPQEYRGNQNLGNVLIALELSQRTNSSPMMVMQNVNIIQGRPSWSSQFIIAALNSCGRFSPLRFSVEGEGDDKTCRAWAYDKASGEVLEGPPVSIRMAKDEGWYGRNGSKWKTMPDTMLRYRAAAFFGRLYAPDILMGMQTADELQDIGPSANAPSAPEPQSGPAPTLAGVQDTEPEEAEVVESEPDPEPDPAQPTLDPHQALGADYIACLICGKQYKTLTRHLSQTHGETPESYRARFGLEDNYPMQAPNLGQGSSQEQGGQQESAAPAGQQEPGL
ncbi:MAG: MucR family transcriptional regulator, partial [Thiohalorhabdus sp.]